MAPITGPAAPHPTPRLAWPLCPLTLSLRKRSVILLHLSPSHLEEQAAMPEVGGGSSSIGQTANQAISAVLGWKPRSDDPKAFLGALTQSFTLTEVEGHVESKWVARSYAVQTDVVGFIDGAQASIYSRAKEALDQSSPLLDGLYALDPTAEQEDARCLPRSRVANSTDATCGRIRVRGWPKSAEGQHLLQSPPWALYSSPRFRRTEQFRSD